MSGDRPTTSPGWFPDPFGRHEHRYFNGTNWTADVADGGERRVDRFGTAPGVPPPGVAAPHSGGGTESGATAALVFGILAVLLAWIPLLVVVGCAFALVAVITGRRGRRSDGPRSGRATAGLWLGVAGLALSVVGVVLTVWVFDEVNEFLEPARHELVTESCQLEDGIATARGSITNESASSAGFTVFVAPLDHRDAVDVVELPDVAPDETVTWQTSHRITAAEPTCEAVVDVYGPFPFGVPVDQP